MNDLLRIAAENNVIVEYADVPNNGSLSVHGQYADYVAIDRTVCRTSAEARTHTAHEIGHCMKGAFYNIYSALDIREKHEYRANKWAIEHLVPFNDLAAAMRNGLCDPWQLAEHFDVTCDFMMKVMMYYGDMSTRDLTF